MRRFVVSAAAAAVVVSSTLAFAATQTVPTQHWVVIQENSNGDCFVADRAPMVAESQIGKGFSSRSAAEAALNNALPCLDARTAQSAQS